MLAPYSNINFSNTILFLIETAGRYCFIKAFLVRVRAEQRLFSERLILLLFDVITINHDKIYYGVRIGKLGFGHRMFEVYLLIFF